MLLALARTLSASLQKSMNETGEKLDGLTAAQSNLSSGKIVSQLLRATSVLEIVSQVLIATSVLVKLSHSCSEQPQFWKDCLTVAQGNLNFGKIVS